MKHLQITKITKATFYVLLLTAIVLPSSGMGQVKDDRLAKQIGQMLMVGFRGLTVDEDSPIIKDISHGRVGGVILFDYDVALDSSQRNIASPQQLQELTADLQAASHETLLLAIDQEGGKVARLKEEDGFPPTVSQAWLGEHNDLKLTRKFASRTAVILSEMGINLNLAPVVDVNANPDNPVIGKLGRSFSSDPEVVARHSAEVITTHRKHNVLTALKHFPGHGSSTHDSHHGFTDITDTWTEAELIPYARLFESPDADMVMTAHVFNANLDPEWPATLSSRILNGLLRQKMGFKGVVISDDMQMGAIRDNYSLETALERTILAGADIIIFGNNLVYEPDIAHKALQIISNLVHEGRISASSILQSNARIMRLKNSLVKVRFGKN
ncbi:MAG: glycoside hydrolase family 3 N-terminal domain-containing protein [Desulfovermiculus sp.]|nr:glycoside hydrolase family 3 N-terminal domain-containing protein [Desulfovermiculus sp.]